ncbi:acyl carrier protein [Parafrankia colletiae]|uniref:Acyl carrier protein n=1 Tax=Parafrankia colletiae TaxID=573497 RepID=A0A1S1QJH4_9ACTN|nr:phosphopantetheine-binding protein [Parafrankia colletiae]MCK9898760.1 acyl carrier protein [Frankia sp. Cpl3]OHV33756.1 acyl carrier protein [Parafrankia colletiae]
MTIDQSTATVSVDPTDRAARVLSEVAAILRDVIGEEYIVDMSIEMDTSFNEDLELESIEFVTFADRLRETYGEHVDFVGFLADMDVDQVINMKVGQVVAFIVDSLDGAPQVAAR